MVETYKKYVLVSLLHSGQVKPMPKNTASVVQRHLKTLCPQYQEFANAFSTNSTDEVHKVATQHAETFTKVPSRPGNMVLESLLTCQFVSGQ